MKEVFDALVAHYKGSELEKIAGVGKIYSSIAPPQTSPPYVIMMMAPSKLNWAMGGGLKVDPMIIIDPRSDFGGDQTEINALMKAALSTYHGAKFTIQGWRLIDIQAVKMNQEIEISDEDYPLWAYPITFKLMLE